MMRPRALASLLIAALIVIATPSAAKLRLEDVHGRMQVGYAKLFADEAPKGSLSIGAGIDVPVPGGLRAGLGFGYHLLGSRTLVQGSLSTGLDFSLIEALAQVHWSPGSGEPQVMLSGGGGLFVARANLGSSPIGASFADFAVEQTRPGLAVGATVLRRRPAPVRLGLEAALRFIPLEDGHWTIVTGRVTFAY